MDLDLSDIPTHELIERVAGVACMVFLVVVCSVRLCPRLGQHCQALCGVLQSMLPLRRRGGIDEDLAEARVMAECERRRVERGRAGAVLGSAVLVLRFAYGIGQVRRGESGSIPRVFFGFAALMGLLTLFPRIVSSRTLDAGYCLVMAALAASVISGDIEGDDDWVMGAAGMGLALSMWNMHFGLNLLCLAVTSGCSLGRRLHLGEPGSSALPDTVRNYLGGALLICWVKFSLEGYIRLQVQAKYSGGQLVAVQKLLEAICDVIVEVGTGFRMVRHSPQLADILLHGPVRSLEGRLLQDFMPEEENRQAFEQNLGGLSEATRQPACVFHTSLRDSNGTAVKMELFAVAFESADGKRRHIVGMRECTDVAPLGPAGPAVSRPRAKPPPEPLVLRGTPAVNEPRALGRRGSDPTAPSASSAAESGGESSDGEGSAHSEGSQGSQGDEGEMPGFKRLQRSLSRTNDHAAVKILCNALMSFKQDKEPGQCCQWHANASWAKEFLKAIGRNGQCDDTWLHTLRQCSRCGALGEKRVKGSKCRVCKGIKTKDLQGGAVESQDPQGAAVETEAERASL